MGEQTFDVPQVHGGGFSPSALERGSRTGQALNLALAEMVVQGVSTRKGCDILVKFPGPEVSISSTPVSRAAERRDAGLAAWRERPLDETPYLFLDARYERVREAGRLVDWAVLVAVGISQDRLLQQALDAWETDAPRLAPWAGETLREGFTVFDRPHSQRTRLRTTNGLERMNRKLKRRTRVASIFPNTASCLRLVSALLAECDEEG